MNVGEEVILLGKIGEAGASEPFSGCYILLPYEQTYLFKQNVTESGSLKNYSYNDINMFVEWGKTASAEDFRSLRAGIKSSLDYKN